MSQENVEILRAVYERWRLGDFWTRDAFRDDVEVVWAADIPDVGTYHGLAGLEASARQWFSAWDELRIEAEKFIDLGERVLVLITVYGRGKDSSIETEGKYAQLWTMRAGKATRFVGYTDWADALEAVGLSEQDAHVDS
jgi:ketosteroid isomerase-like protein